MTSEKVNLLGLDRGAMREFFIAQGEKPFRAQQILQWVHQQGVTDFDSMTNLSKTLRGRLREIAEIRAPEVVFDRTAQDGTRKWLLRLDSGNCIEAVFIPEQDRGTLCVSSQLGCILDCSFCATGKQGFNRNLSIAEIIGQVWVANQALNKDFPGDRPITNIVLMGMGEPLYNFDNVVKALQLMLDDWTYGLSRRRVTLSTAGVVPAIDRLREAVSVSLAVSLHAPNDALRDELVPLNKRYPLKELLAACKRYVANDPGRSITFEYVMLDGVNDSEKMAHELVQLLRGIPVKVNLIPFNPFPNTQYACSSSSSIEKFRTILMEAGLLTITRRTRGDDIDAACGQLAGQVQDRTRRRVRYAVSRETV